VRWAITQAEARHGEVTAVLAWQVPFLSFPGAFNKDELEQAAKNFLVETVSAVALSPPVPLRPLVAEGDPAEALVVASRDADHLVVSSRGRSPFMGSALGAVSLRCASAASCPVTLVKLPGEGQQNPPPAKADSKTQLRSGPTW
jgi:nucleotide-binding universal stress UspA family protein